jgi:hypothetical protein
MPPCHGRKKNGTACTQHAKHGHDYCWRHVPREADDTVDGTRARNERWDREAFLGAFEYTKMVSEACRMVGISRQTAYMERQRNEEFAVAWADVEEKAVECLEAEAFRRAHDGTTKMIVSAGKDMGTEKQYSDSLLMFLLKAKRPERYLDRMAVAHSGKVEQQVRVDLSKLDPDDLEALERISGKLAEAA